MSAQEIQSIAIEAQAVLFVLAQITIVLSGITLIMPFLPKRIGGTLLSIGIGVAIIASLGPDFLVAAFTTINA